MAERNRVLLLVPEFSKDDFPEDTDHNMDRMFTMDSNDVPQSKVPEGEWSFPSSNWA
jgi:hypothetical protein